MTADLCEGRQPKFIGHGAERVWLAADRIRLGERIRTSSASTGHDTNTEERRFLLVIYHLSFPTSTSFFQSLRLFLSSSLPLSPTPNPPYPYSLSFSPHPHSPCSAPCSFGCGSLEMAIDDESPLRVNTRGGGTVVTWIAHPLLYSFSFGALFLRSLLDWAGANGGAGSNAAGRRRVRRRGEPAVAAVAEAAAVHELLRPMQDPRGRTQERVQHVLPRLHERRALLPLPRAPPRPPLHPGQ